MTQDPAGYLDRCQRLLLCFRFCFLLLLCLDLCSFHGGRRRHWQLWRRRPSGGLVWQQSAHFWYRQKLSLFWLWQYGLGRLRLAGRLHCDRCLLLLRFGWFPIRRLWRR
jgi:hypothetical protein